MDFTCTENLTYLYLYLDQYTLLLPVRGILHSIETVSLLSLFCRSINVVTHQHRKWTGSRGLRNRMFPSLCLGHISKLGKANDKRTKQNILSRQASLKEGLVAFFRSIPVLRDSLPQSWSAQHILPCHPFLSPFFLKKKASSLLPTSSRSSFSKEESYSEPSI